MSNDAPVIDELGLKLDSSDVLTHPPAIILYGPSGGGKSIEMARAFPNCLYIQTAPTVLRPYASFLGWCKKMSAEDPKEMERLGYDPAILTQENLKMPNKITIPKFRPGTNEVIDPRPILQKIFTNFIKACTKGTNPYDGIVVDEWTEMSFRIQQGIEQDNSFGRNNFKRITALKDLHYQLAELPRATNTVLGLVCHELPPVFDFEEGSPTYGQMKLRGGPRLAIKSLTHEVSAAMDIVLRVLIENDAIPGSPSKRFYQTELQKDWICKFRNWGQENKEKLGLRALLGRAGYQL